MAVANRLAEDLCDRPAIMSGSQLAELLGVPARTLEHWRVTGDGPPFLRVGKHCRYARSSVAAWLREREAKNTAEASALRDAQRTPAESLA